MGKPRQTSEIKADRPARSARLPLSRDEIILLDAALIRAFQAFHELRAVNPSAKYIKFPSLPSVFSESLVIASARNLFGHEWAARYGGKDCDVLIENQRGEVRRIAVKATGKHAFQEFKAKDLQADILVWVRFGRRYQEGQGPIQIVILNNPGGFIPSPCRLDTLRFERLLGQNAGARALSFASLEEMLTDCSQ